MINYIRYYYFRIKSGIKKKYIVKYGVNKYFSNKRRYAGRIIYPFADIQSRIYYLLDGSKPCMIARFGANELHAMNVVENNLVNKQIVSLEHMYNEAGFFPKELLYMNEFTEVMKKSCTILDCLAIWNLSGEEYFIRKYTNKKVYLSRLRNLEPWWNNVQKPWTSALRDKKVLVIHPFETTIKSQYKKRELLFGNKDILPEFELKTLKAVQTIAGEKDDRFETWFDALDWMYQEAMKIEFDVAIIGCGAYGFPLAAKIKGSGKHAIHLGGVTQILFGIKGKRWDEDQDATVRDLYNEYWVYPSEEDRPENASKVEGGCYW